jgi:hypothetical protein
MVTGAACSLTVNYLDDNGNVFTSLNAASSSTVTWVSNADAPVSWLNNSSNPVNWTSSSATQQNVFQFDGPGRLRAFAINTQTTGTGIYLQNISIGFKHTEAGLGT